MTESQKQFDDTNREALARDLKRLYRPPGPIPEDLDRRIVARMAVGPGRRFSLYRAVAAAAAVVLVAAALWIWRPTADKAQSVAMDIDRNGRVDILDAFRIARQLKTHGSVDPAWDVNADGRVGQEDVDLVARAAVRIIDPRKVL